MANPSMQIVRASGDRIKVVLAVCIGIAGIIGFYLLADKLFIIRVAILIGTLIVSVILISVSASGRVFLGFAKESVRETKKVIWPTRKEALQITAVVFGFTFLMALFLWGTDKLLEVMLYDVILGWKK